MSHSEKYKYLVTCQIGLERDGNYEKRNAIASKWVPANGAELDGVHGNLAAHVLFNRETKKASFSKEWASGDEENVSLYQAIPSALALYRLISTIPGVKVETFDDAYKCVWSLGLVNTTTNEVVFFGEHKGGFSFWTPHMSAAKAPKELLKDLKELLTYLVSDECAHPYDGLVAGSVA